MHLGGERVTVVAELDFPDELLALSVAEQALIFLRGELAHICWSSVIPEMRGCSRDIRQGLETFGCHSGEWGALAPSG